MAPTEPQRVRVAICGAGIAGLALAAFLSKFDQIQADLYEASDEIRLPGAGIALWRRHVDLLRDELDFVTACAGQGFALPDWSQVKGPAVRQSDTAGAAGYEFCVLEHGPVVVPRACVTNVLRSKINEERCRVHTGKRLVRYERASPAGTVDLYFDDGHEASCDLLVGADGVFSQVRRVFFGHDPSMAQHHFSGQLASRMSCNAHVLRQLKHDHIALQGFRIWAGRGRHVTSTVVDSQIQITVWDNVPADARSGTETKVKEVHRQSVTSAFQSWEPDLVSLLEHAGATASQWPVHVVARLPCYVTTSAAGGANVALIGDAAHGMTPHQGMGGGQGLEDAFILARLLESVTGDRNTLPERLAVYDEVRRPVSQSVAHQSLMNGHIFSFLRGFGSRDEADLAVIGAELIHSQGWLYRGNSCEDEAARAKSLLAIYLGPPGERSVTS